MCAILYKGNISRISNIVKRHLHATQCKAQPRISEYRYTSKSKHADSTQRGRTANNMLTHKAKTETDEKGQAETRIQVRIKTIRRRWV